MIRKVLIVLTGLLYAGPLVADTVTVSASNARLFTAVSSKDKFYCYAAPKRTAQFGVLNSAILKKGAVWTSQSGSLIKRQLSALSRRLKRASRATRRSIQSAITKNQKLLSRVSLFQSYCSQKGDFLGSEGSLESYRERLSSVEVAHLLNKVAYGGSSELRRIGETQGLTALVDALVDGTGLANPSADAQFEANNRFWTERELYEYDDLPGVKIWTAQSAEVGQLHRLYFSRYPFREWMTLFWQAHFATNINAIDFSYSKSNHLGIPQHWELLKRNALGNFRTMVGEMIADSAMNRWLNNEDNHADSPNQNFAREFLELFTLGAVDPISLQPNYDESSIVASTAFFSGFYGDERKDSTTGEYMRFVGYNKDLHDTTTHRVFTGVAGADLTSSFDWTTFPDHVLYHHPGSPRYLAERLFGQMVYPNVSDGTVVTLAHQLLANRYELKPVLKTILRSRAMFSNAAREVCVQSPVELFSRLERRLAPNEFSHNGTKDELDGRSWYFANSLNHQSAAGQRIFEPPSVFAWKGACGLNRAGHHSYGEGWITAQSLLSRDKGCTDYMNDLQSNDYPFTSLVHKGQTPSEVVSSLAHSLFDFQPRREDAADMEYFLTHEKVDASTYATLDVDFSDEYYVRRKIPKLICILFSQIESNVK